MVFDPSDPIFDEEKYELKYWTSSNFGHVQGQEELSPNTPQPCGLVFVMRAKVDKDHAYNNVTII